MSRLQRSLAAGLTLLFIAGCTKAEAPPADSSATAAAPASSADEEAAVKAVNDSWFAHFRAGHADSVAALYADDAVLYVPGAPMARGRAAILAAYQKDLAAMAKAGLANNQGNNAERSVSGDMAWESNTFTVTDKSGKTVDTGKYITVFAKRDGKWMIVRDIWNSDGPAPAG